jgi:hypothetical protein
MQPVKRSSGGQSGCLAYLGALFILLACLGFLFFVPLMGGNFTLANLLSSQVIGGLIGGGLFGFAFFVVGAIMMVIGVRVLLARARLTRPEVALSTQTPRVGEVVSLSYKQNFKSATDVQGIRFQMVLREKAIYRRGTDTFTVTHDNVAQEYQIAGRHFDAGEGIQDQRQFRVLGMHSFNASNNKLD